MYGHGMDNVWVLVGVTVGILIGMTVTLPVLYPLKLSSPNEVTQCAESAFLRSLFMRVAVNDSLFSCLY